MNRRTTCAQASCHSHVNTLRGQKPIKAEMARAGRGKNKGYEHLIDGEGGREAGATGEKEREETEWWWCCGADGGKEEVDARVSCTLPLPMQRKKGTWSPGGTVCTRTVMDWLDTLIACLLLLFHFLTFSSPPPPASHCTPPPPPPPTPRPECVPSLAPAGIWSAPSPRPLFSPLLSWRVAFFYSCPVTRCLVLRTVQRTSTTNERISSKYRIRADLQGKSTHAHPIAIDCCPFMLFVCAMNIYIYIL